MRSRFFVLTFLAAGCSDSGGTETFQDAGPGCVTADVADVASCTEIVGLGFPCEGQGHSEDAADLVWLNNPPHSGVHLPRWERERGEHTEPIPRGNWIHNLEHGWVVLLYNCPEGCDAELQVLRDVVAQRPDTRLLLTPDPDLDAPRFAAVSWTWVYETDAPNLETLLCFADQHHRQAPEDVP
jgi:hypothetical protein